MKNESVISGGKSQLLTRVARSLIVRPGQFVANQIAPDISRAGLVLGKYWVAEDVTPVADQLGELMDPNIIDVNKAIPNIDFVIEDHELQAKVSKRFLAAMHEEGLDDGQANELVTAMLVSKVKAMQEATTFNITTTAANYASGMADSNSKGWDNAGDPYADIMAAIAALDAQGAPTDSLYIAAAPKVWQAITTKVASRFSGIQARITPDDVAGLFGAKAVVARYSIGGTNVAGDSCQIFCRPEFVNDDSLTAWRTVNAGLSGAAEPTIYQYQPEGKAHRYYVIGCYHDYKVVATGANASGKQRWGFLYKDVV